MDTQNVTLSIPKEVLRKAKTIALQKRVSLSRLLTHALEDLVAYEADYQNAQTRHKTILEQGYDLGTNGDIPWSREDLHARE